jgi:hypothetical protein
VATVAEVSGKEIHVERVDGPVGVQSRNPSTRSGHRFSSARIYSLGWRAKVFLEACPERSRRVANVLGFQMTGVQRRSEQSGWRMATRRGAEGQRSKGAEAQG